MTAKVHAKERKSHEFGKSRALARLEPLTARQVKWLRPARDIIYSSRIRVKNIIVCTEYLCMRKYIYVATDEPDRAVWSIPLNLI